MRKDIQAINEAFSKVHKEQSDNTGMQSQQDKLKEYEKFFYGKWEDIIDRLSDDELKATMHMISHYNELNKLVEEEYRYRFLSTIE